VSKRSKSLRAADAKIDRDKLYAPLEAVRLAKETSTSKFDGTVEVAFRLGVDPRKADQMVRGTVNLPHGTGKTARVLVFATGDRAAAAEAAGADIVGSDELIDEVAKGRLDFDAVVATPDLMGKVGRLGRVLGPRGLMPNPKTGTVTMDVAKAVTEIKGGKIEFRVDKHSNLHFIIGKVSFDDTKLVENYGAALDEISKGNRLNEFDAVVATPDLMGKVGRLGRVLGPRGLMPNPKTGTVTPDVAKAVTEIKGGKIEFRVDKHSNLHFIIGKASFDDTQLVENYGAALDEILRLKPSAAKGRYIKKAAISSTIGPGVPIDPNRTRNLLVEEDPAAV
jgi:large subunit ribosomal protein L1